MLVLQRKIGESIAIGRNFVRIQVVEIRGKSVRLGIDAPRELPVNREEIQREIDGELGNE
jgi:carbon storage regulator